MKAGNPMKLKLYAFSFTLASLLGLSQSALAATTYPLICRGGTNIVLSSTTNGPYGELALYTYFAASTARASDSMPAGTCAWLDRGMRSNEPSTLAQYVPLNSTNYVSTFIYNG